MTELRDLRKKLNLLNDVQLDAFALDEFPDVYRRFSRGLQTDEKINLLLDHCRRSTRDLERLARLLEGDGPASAPQSADEPDARGRLSSTPIPPATEIRHRYALLIGVSKYTDENNFRPLPHTVPDVIALEAVLAGAGYIVRCLHSAQSKEILQPTRDNIWGELEHLASSTQLGDLLLVYFGGHAVEENGKVYLLPSGARGSAIERTGIPLDDFQKTIEAAGAQARVLIMDACHSGIGRDDQHMSEAFERRLLLQSHGMAVLASCRRGEKAYEHDQSEHGAFTYFLLEGLRGAARLPDMPLVTFSSLYNYISPQVKHWAIRRGVSQWPNKQDGFAGDAPLVEFL